MAGRCFLSTRLLVGSTYGGSRPHFLVSSIFPRSVIIIPAYRTERRLFLPTSDFVSESDPGTHSLSRILSDAAAYFLPAISYPGTARIVTPGLTPGGFDTRPPPHPWLPSRILHQSRSGDACADQCNWPGWNHRWVCPFHRAGDAPPPSPCRQPDGRSFPANRRPSPAKLARTYLPQSRRRLTVAR